MARGHLHSPTNSSSVLVQSPDALNGLRKSLKQLDSVEITVFSHSTDISQLDLDKLIANVRQHSS